MHVISSTHHLVEDSADADSVGVVELGHGDAVDLDHVVLFKRDVEVECVELNVDGLDPAVVASAGVLLFPVFYVHSEKTKHRHHVMGLTVLTF